MTQEDSNWSIITAKMKNTIEKIRELLKKSTKIDINNDDEHKVRLIKMYVLNTVTFLELQLKGETIDSKHQVWIDLMKIKNLMTRYDEHCAMEVNEIKVIKL